MLDRVQIKRNIGVSIGGISVIVKSGIHRKSCATAVLFGLLDIE